MTEHDKTLAAVKDYYGAAIGGARDSRPRRAAATKRSRRAIKRSSPRSTTKSSTASMAAARRSRRAWRLHRARSRLRRRTRRLSASRLVGPRGLVIGVDMTAEPLRWRAAIGMRRPNISAFLAPTSIFARAGSRTSRRSASPMLRSTS